MKRGLFILALILVFVGAVPALIGAVFVAQAALDEDFARGFAIMLLALPCWTVSGLLAVRGTKREDI